MKTIVGSTLDPDRTLGAFEATAVKILKEPLVHNWTGDKLLRDKRDTQMRVLYEDHDWSLADIAAAWDLTKEGVRLCIKRAGGTTRKAVPRTPRRYPG